MTKSEIIQDISLAPDAEKWDIIIKNKDKIILILDNNDTYIVDKSTNESTEFSSGIGKEMGICILLGHLSIESEYA